MADFYSLSFLATVIQGCGTALVAGLLLPLSRAMPGNGLRLAVAAWGFQTAGLAAFILSARGPAEVRLPLQSLYLLGGQAFAFFLWAACRGFRTGRDLRRADWLPLAVPAAFALVGPAALPQRWQVYAVHTGVLAGLFLMALGEAARLPGRGVGRWVARAALATLAGLFAHYTVVVGLLSGGSVDGFDYLAFASLYDLFLQTALAFGLVVLAADRTRELLEDKNRALAAAAAELAAVARTDPLTGLLNRRGFEQVLADHAARPHHGAVAVLDLNDLKRINDAHGHPAGDAALQLVARALRGRFRVTDPICRTGGDEFVVVMPGCTAPELCGRLAGLEVELAGQRLPDVAEPVDLPVAWGAAPFAADLPAAHDAADRTMYTHKRLMKASPRPAV